MPGSVDRHGVTVAGFALLHATLSEARDVYQVPVRSVTLSNQLIKLRPLDDPAINNARELQPLSGRDSRTNNDKGLLEVC